MVIHIAGKIIAQCNVVSRFVHGTMKPHSVIFHNVNIATRSIPKRDTMTVALQKYD